MKFSFPFHRFFYFVFYLLHGSQDIFLKLINKSGKNAY